MHIFVMTEPQPEVFGRTIHLKLEPNLQSPLIETEEC